MELDETSIMALYLLFLMYSSVDSYVVYKKVARKPSKTGKKK